MPDSLRKASDGLSRRPLKAALGVAVASMALVSCGGGVSGTKVTVPVLWAADQEDGSVKGGIEPAGVEVGAVGEPGYGLVLDDLEAKDAGPQWKAASSSASAVGTIVGGRDPNEVDVEFTITGPIDGPSGGGALTVGVLAAIRGDRPREGVTMTGTINPGGSIGRVTHVPTKLRAASREGFERVLIPASAPREFDAKTGREVSLAKLGKRLGLEVTPVSNLGQAYRAFTGKTIAPVTRETAELGARTAEAASRTARALVERLESEIATAPDAAATPQIRRQTQAAKSALAQGNAARAYGLGANAYLTLVRLIARSSSGDVYEQEGPRAAAAGLRSERRALERKARRTLRRLSRTGRLSADQRVLLPDALVWVAYAEAVLQGLEKDRPEGGKPERRWIERTAAVLADERAQIEVFAPDAVAVLRAGGETDAREGGGSASDVASFLSGYTNFMARAGKANETYYRDVVEPSGGSVPPYVEAATAALGKKVRQMPAGENALRAEVVQSARTLSYFTLGSALVGGDYSQTLSGAGIGEDAGRGRADRLLEGQVLGTSSLANALAVDLQRRGREVDYAVWQTRWGLSLFRALRRTQRGANAALIALGEIQPASIGGFMVSALARAEARAADAE